MLGMSPLAMLYAAAPHLWGETDRESAMRFRMINIIETLSLETIEPLAAVLEKLAELEKADDGGQSSNVVITSLNWASASADPDFLLGDIGVHIRAPGVASVTADKLLAIYPELAANDNLQQTPTE